MKTKDNITRKVAQDLGVPMTVVAPIFDAIFTVIAAEVAKGESVQFRQFGTFSRKITNAKKARNPKTGATVQVPAKVSARFVAGKSFMSLLAGDKAAGEVEEDLKLKATLAHLGVKG